MQRRNFIKNTALCAVAVTASGFIRFDGNKYVGDCETTTDILGPFYRPGSPVRSSLVVKGEPGDAITLSGIVTHKDCATPYKNAKVELWHCSSKGEYDNATDAYKYRGTIYTDDQGRYSFDTILPVPYDVGGGNFRPAHFHMMISAEGYQSLVTQLYFTGDPHISKDESSSAPTAKKRILDIQQGADGIKKVQYNVGMTDVLLVEPSSMDKLLGTYINEKDSKDQATFFAKNKTLWMKNELYGMNFNYIGDNSFQYPGIANGSSWTLHFEILSSGGVKLTQTYINEKGVKDVSISIKEK
jgi:protocatechuate 3,4-dioxygenase beta subunit